MILRKLFGCVGWARCLCSPMQTPRGQMKLAHPTTMQSITHPPLCILMDALCLSTLRLISNTHNVLTFIGVHLRALGFAFALVAAPVCAEDMSTFFDLTENPEGKTEQPPLSLSSHPIGENTEQHLPPDEIFTLWIQDETFFRPKGEDRVEMQKVLEKEVKTHKLENVVKPIGFASGDAEIPVEFVTQLRNILNGMKNRANVRLHFIGHSDSDKLGPAASAKYGDNYGLSKARAEIAAVFFQRELDLPPDAVSYDGAGDSMPIASNETAEGKTRNRRVEVQVWYDEINETAVEKEVLVVAPTLNRVKVCRKETVCKLQYKEGSAKRTRLRNLVAPLRMEEGEVEIPAEFIRQIIETLHNLRDKQNVMLRFVGHTDSIPLEGREQLIYGGHIALSKARARRVALAIQDVLKLPNDAIGSDGKGASLPVAGNDSAQGRGLNRRVEVEFWHDDPFETITDDAQACPEAAAAETITLGYEPPSGPIEPVKFINSQPVFMPGYAARIKRLMDEIPEKANVRLSFVGYTSNERMDRRAAMVYGDDIGLSTSRARRVMESIKNELGLTDKQVQFEGRGFVQSNDVISTGFTQSDNSRVDVQIVYDELAVLDEDKNLDIERIDRETIAQTPYALNMMRISVDGKPIDDPYKNIEDLQRCTDVALDQAKIEFKFDNLTLKPRLNITAWPNTIRYQDDVNTEAQENTVRFRAYSNYPVFIHKYEVRIFEEEQSIQDQPLAIIELDSNHEGIWQAQFEEFKAPLMKLKYLLRVYDDLKDQNMHFDETKALPLWLVSEIRNNDLNADKNPDANKELLAGYGENHIAIQNIPLKGGSVSAYGSNIPVDHSVWLAGHPVPVSDKGEFVVEEIFPPGFQTVEVAVLDKEGNGNLFLRELELQKNDWFYVGIADVTASLDNTKGPAELVTQDSAHYDNGLAVDGRLAFYTNGKFGDNWKLTASADTREGPINELFSNFLNKAPDALFRSLDPDYYYPTFGDDSIVEDMAPTLGKMYAKLQRNENFGMWGNFKIEYTDTDLAHIDRGLYGANGHYQSDDMTTFGEEKLMVNGFAAEPGTIAGRDEYRGTGGSVYFMRHQNIMVGSDRLRIEIRDQDSGRVIGVKNLIASLDYDIDYIQGRILLGEPLSSTASASMLVNNGSLAGNPAYLVARYEYTPGFDELNDVATGGRVHYWLNENVKLGLTASDQEEIGNNNSLNGVDVILRKSAGTWLKMEVAKSTGQGVQTLNSNDGGFNFDELNGGASTDITAGAYQLDSNIRIDEFINGVRGNATFYKQNREAGFSAPGQLAATDIDQVGGTLSMPVTDRIDINAKADKKDQKDSLKTTSLEVDAGFQLNQFWHLSSGARIDSREDHSVVVPITQLQGDRTDITVEAAYDSHNAWSAYGFAQATANATGNRDNNNRYGSGGSFQATDRLALMGELSGGNTGMGAKIGTDYLYSDRTNIYMNYALENERADNGIASRRGNMTTGARSRYTDTTSVYFEERYAFGDVPTGLTHAAGVDISPDDRWNYGGSLELGTLEDQQTGATTERTAIGVLMGYAFANTKVASAVEWRSDLSENPDTAQVTDRETWFWKNSIKYQINLDWRLVGKLNWSESTSSQGEFYDGNFTEVVVGYGYRPVLNDRWNTLAKYTYFYNVPTVDQQLLPNTAAEFIQKSHIFSIDTLHDLTQRWSVGGKYAYRLGQVSQERVDPEFFDSRASLYVLRADWHFMHRWDALMEARLLDLPDAQDRRSGALLGLYRHMGKNFKFGVGYNFTDFSDDLTQLNFTSQGVFINLIGQM
jgi:flagellar motor protein MotB